MSARSYTLQSGHDAGKVSAWVKQLMEMDECEFSPTALRAIAQKWNRGSPEPLELILELVEDQVMQEFDPA